MYLSIDVRSLTIVLLTSLYVKKRYSHLPLNTFN